MWKDAKTNNVSVAEARRRMEEWASVFSEEMFVILSVYADEFETPGPKGKRAGVQFIALGGYVASQVDWVKLSVRWRAVLVKYDVPCFHFKEFHSKEKCAEESSPYFGWSEEKRDNFFYELAMTTTEEMLVPVGGDYRIGKHRELKIPADPYKQLFRQFFNDIRVAVDSHAPGYKGRILFILDQKNSKVWRNAAFDIHDEFKQTDKRFGGVTFEDDTDPEHVGLQAADLLAAIYRQTAEEKYQSGKLQPTRIIDLILFRHLRPKGHPWYMDIKPGVFKPMIEQMRADEKRQKRIWKDKGLRRKRYYPSIHFPFPWNKVD